MNYFADRVSAAILLFLANTVERGYSRMLPPVGNFPAPPREKILANWMYVFRLYFSGFE